MDMITPAGEMAKAHRNDFEKACIGIMKRIREANAKGYRDTCFTPHPVEQYDAVKAEFRKNGYTFKPTGRIGGVWQDSEQICW